MGLNDAVDVVSRGLDRMQWLWVFRHSDDKVLLPLILNRMALSQMDKVHNLGVLLDSRLLLEEKVAAMARRPFAYFQVVHQLHPFLVWEALLTIIHGLLTSWSVLLQHSLYWAALKIFGSFN